MIALRIAAAVGASTAAIIGFVQAATAESLVTGAEHTMGAGALAGGLTWLALRDRVAKHDEDIKAVNTKLDKLAEVQAEIQEGVAYMRGEAHGREQGNVRTRKTDPTYPAP